MYPNVLRTILMLSAVVGIIYFLTSDELQVSPETGTESQSSMSINSNSVSDNDIPSSNQTETPRNSETENKNVSVAGYDGDDNEYANV